MSISRQDRKTLVPTIVIGLGGTGLEIIHRLRHLVQTSYGHLNRLPTLEFLHIDTDPHPTLAQPTEIDLPLEQHQQFGAGVRGEEVDRIIRSPEHYTWFHQWLPAECRTQPELLASDRSTQRLRASGRFAFFFHYSEIRERCLALRKKLQGHEPHLVAQHGLSVLPRLNLFVVSSLLGGTGSGMMIDLGYALRAWFAPERAVETIGFLLYPDPFLGINIHQRERENSYAALMELNYFADARTRYSAAYGPNDDLLIEDSRPPYDFTYLVGPNNGQAGSLQLETIYDKVAQNLFLELIPGHSAYKRAVRHKIRQRIKPKADIPVQGRSYPRDFLSFGIASIETPIQQIRRAIAARLIADLFEWWLNREAAVPNDVHNCATRELQTLKLLGKELRTAIISTGERQSHAQTIQLWVEDLAERALARNQLECTAQLPNLPPFAQENGRILQFVEGYLNPNVEQFQDRYFQEDSADLLTQGEFIQGMHYNRCLLRQAAADRLSTLFSIALSHRQQGPQFFRALLTAMRQVLNVEMRQLEQEATQTWALIEQSGLNEYEEACRRMQEFAPRWAAQKQAWMYQQLQVALRAQGKAFHARLERKGCHMGLLTLREVQTLLSQWQQRLDAWSQRISDSAHRFRQQAGELAQQASRSEPGQIRLFQHQNFKPLYFDFLSHHYGLDGLGERLTKRILRRSQCSEFWSDAQASFWLSDVAALDGPNYANFEALAYKAVLRLVKAAPPESQLGQGQSICSCLAALYPQSMDQAAQIHGLIKQAKPLVRLDRQIPFGRFDYVESIQASFRGDPQIDKALVEQIDHLLQRQLEAESEGSFWTVAPLALSQRHKLIVVQETGGFSLRCLVGIEALRKAYQRWRGDRLQAERARLRSEAVEQPLPVHIQDEIVFWDITPGDSAVERLVVLARAFGILWEAFNPRTERNAIHYHPLQQPSKHAILLATNWEEAIQVLELSECLEDRQEIQRQLDALLAQAITELQKHDLRHRLETYLDMMLFSDFPTTGHADPIYQRQKAIVEKFIGANRL
jgi:hypothetical protein